MNLDSSISIDVLGIIALCFTIYIAMRNVVINNYKTKLYISASIATIALMVLEIMTIIFQSANSNNFIVLNKMTNIVGFAISPLVPYILLLFSSRSSYYHSKLLYIPLLFNALICMFSYSNGLVFFINDQNQYTRGSFFLIPTVISMVYYILLITSTSKQDYKFDCGDRTYLTLVFILPIIAMILQILFNELILIWGTVSISLLLYYIFLRELQFKYDTLSEIKNRSAFEKALEQYQKNDISAVIIVFDLNDFKKINDCYGHNEGDNAIHIAAKILKESFDGIGEPYRIGGDEFCVICKNAKKQSVDNALLKIEHLTNIVCRNQKIKIIFAYGYDMYISNENKSIYDTFTNADKSMYEHKSKLKGLSARRKDDKKVSTT